MPGRGSRADADRLPAPARAAVEAALRSDEHLRVILLGTFGSALVATDRHVLMWKNGNLESYAWASLSEVAFGGSGLVRWVQVRGPDIGLTRPGLLNVGRLPDTIQIDEVDAARPRAALEALARSRVKGRRAALRTSKATAKTGGTTTSPGPLVEAPAAGGWIELLPDRVRLHHTGFRGFLRKSLPDCRDIALGEIGAVEWHAAGPLRLGRIAFRTSDEPSGKPLPENELRFYLHQEPALRSLEATVRRLRTRRTR